MRIAYKSYMCEQGTRLLRFPRRKDRGTCGELENQGLRPDKGVVSQRLQGKSTPFSAKFLSYRSNSNLLA